MFIWIKYVEDEKEYVLNINDLSVAPTINEGGETIQQVLKRLERIREKNVLFYDLLYKRQPEQLYKEKKEYYKNMSFKIFKGYELKNFIKNKTENKDVKI